MSTILTPAPTSSRPGPARPGVLCVDDEPDVLEGITDVLRRSFDVRTATSGVGGLDVLRGDPEAFAVVISDMRMPGMIGSEFLRAARLVAPHAVRVLLTGDADIHVAIRAVNDAHLFRFLTKPCESQDLMRACVAALGQHRLQTAERVLLQETLRGSVEALTEVLALTNPTAFGRWERVKLLAGDLARAAKLQNWWEVEVASMLAHVGTVTLPEPTAEKLYAGAALTPSEAAMVKRVPLITRQLLGKIPRLEGVQAILDNYQEALEGEEAEGSPSAIPPGARVLRIAVDYADLESQGASPAVAVGAMRHRDAYDRGLMDLFSAIVAAGAQVRVREVTLAELLVGMTLADDARTTRDGLLIARGQRVTERLLERLSNLGEGTVRQPLRVFDSDS
jgi:response regulator RpfG family c-di-GMP phosphodiesterase